MVQADPLQAGGGEGKKIHSPLKPVSWVLGSVVQGYVLDEDMEEEQVNLKQIMHKSYCS